MGLNSVRINRRSEDLRGRINTSSIMVRNGSSIMQGEAGQVTFG